MITVNKLIAQGRGLAPALLKRAPGVTLGWDLRQKSRFEATDDAGRRIGVFLPRGSVVRGGDVLVAEDGSLIVVRAAPQPLLVVRPCSEHGAPSDLLRAAYHLGNRHVAVELRGEQLRLEPDTVLAEMLRRMHLIVSEEPGPFEPEGGAYEGGDGHACHDGHEHGHAQRDGQGHGDGHDHGDGTGPAHGDSGGHRHGHGDAHGHEHGHDVGHGHANDRGHRHS